MWSRGWWGALLVLVMSQMACRRVDHAGVPLRLWAMGREGEVVRQLVADFERQTSGVRVEVQQIPWGAAHEKLLTAFVGDALPDVFQAGNTWLPELAALGALAPLDARIAASAVVQRDDYFPGILDTNVIDGVTYGVPWYVDTRLLFYRRDLLARAGYAHAPRRWEEWWAAMTRVKEQAGNDAYAILLPFSEWQLPVIFAWQAGAELLRDGDRYGNFRSPAFRAGFERYVQLFAAGLAPSGGAAQVANVYQDFAAGYFTFYVTGPWNLGEMHARLPDTLQDAWATAPLPGLNDDAPGVSVAGGSSLVLSASSPRQSAAWQLIEYLSQPAVQQRFYELSGDLPPRRSVWRRAGLSDEPRARAFEAQLQHVRSAPKIPEWERIAARIMQYAEAAVRGSLSVEAALQGLDADCDVILEKRRWLLARRAALPPAALPGVGGG